MLGDRVWQRDLRLRVALGPLDHAQFQRFLPGTVGAQALESMLTLCHGVSLEYEVNLLLRRDQVQGCSLDSTRSPHRPGWAGTLFAHRGGRDRPPGRELRHPCGGVTPNADAHHTPRDERHEPTPQDLDLQAQ